MVVDVKVHLVMCDALPPEGLLAGACACHRHAKHAHHCGTLHPPEPAGLSSTNGVCHDAPLPVSGSRQGDQRVLPGHHVPDLHRITHRVDVGVRGAHAVIHLDTAPSTQLQACCLGQSGFGAHTNDQHDQVCLVLGPRGSGHQQAAACRVLLKARHSVPQVQRHALLAQVVVQGLHHLGVKGGHHLGQHLHQTGLDAQVHQVLHHLQTNEAAPYHHGSLDIVLLDPGLDCTRVRDGLHAEDAGQVKAGQRGPDGRGPWGQHKLVIGVLLLFTTLEVLRCHCLGLAVNRNDLC
mmetsp:Transcript_31359/g.69800  ORF Transcript_31359/g.69800 Transcript_31359/m.69800 type:complete len:292 (-) Transcript_31359:387-1262(-)